MTMENTWLPATLSQTVRAASWGQRGVRRSFHVDSFCFGHSSNYSGSCRKFCIIAYPLKVEIVLVQLRHRKDGSL
jgi:hypothetical protein